LAGRTSQGLPIFVSAGSVPPKQTGLPVLRISGAIAWFCVERIEPRKATMSGCAASLEKASTAPGFVVWSSSVTSSTCLPRTPPPLLTRSSAILAPASAYLPPVGGGAGHRQHHADLDRIVGGVGGARQRGRRQTRGEPKVDGPSGEPHAFLPRSPAGSGGQSLDGRRFRLKLAEIWTSLQAGSVRRLKALQPTELQDRVAEFDRCPTEPGSLGAPSVPPISVMQTGAPINRHAMPEVC
jgi:hypothetical protein